MVDAMKPIRRVVTGNDAQGRGYNLVFHGDTGAGLGASHQTGWTALVADLLRRGR